jgi:tetratricopeptide (TPR) repeat protein
LVGESLSLEQLEAEFGAAPDDDEGSPGQRFGAALVARNPDAVFLVDDAHAIGGSVLDAVLTIARRASTAIATRPEGIGALVGFDLPPIDASVVLGPLPRAATIETLVATNRLSADEAATVFARCDGYPFAMNAFLRLMHGGAAPETLPDEIALVVERRLRSRGERTARVASIYAVEPSATPDEAAELLRCSEDEVLDAIDDLLALGIFTDDDDGVRFEHALFHEHARKLISSSRRKRFHEFFAERLGRRAEYGDPDRIAFHLASCDRHLDAARAYLRAGTLLAEQRRFGDARERFEAAVAATERDARPESRITRIEAYAANARALMALGLYYPACAAIGAARELLTPDDDEGLQADVLVAAASAHNFIEETQRAEGFAREALRHAYASGDERRIAHCATIGANVTTRAEAPSGPAFVAEATEAARRIGDESAELNALLVRAFEIVRAGRYAEAMRLVNDDAMRIRIADPLMVARRLLVQSTLDLVVHRRAEARTKAREALALIESVQPGRWTPNPAAAPERMRYHALRFIAGCASLLGEHDEAISIGEAALTSPVCAVASEYAHTADFLIKSLLLRGLAGDRERARRLLERRPSGDVANAAAFICADEALVAAAFGEHAAVEERVRHAFDLVDRFWTIDAHELDEFYAMLARASAQAGLSALAAAAVERGAEAFDVRRQQSAEYWGGPERYAVELPGALLRPS